MLKNQFYQMSQDEIIITIECLNDLLERLPLAHPQIPSVMNRIEQYIEEYKSTLIYDC